MTKSIGKLGTSIGYGATPAEAAREAHESDNKAWLASGFVGKGKRNAVSTTLVFNPQNRTLNDLWIFTITTEYERPE